MRQYMNLVDDITTYGEFRRDRTGVGTFSIFGHQMKFDLREGFPLLTLKNTHWKSIVAELVWMLRGETNINTLDARIWDEWADEKGELGPIYGAQWRSWQAWTDDHDSLGTPYVIDQLAEVIDQIKNNPWSRRLVVSAWNPADIPKMALAPCHTLFQFYVRSDEEGNPAHLDCQLYQRSGDVFLGVPFNIASYALLTHLVAQVTGLQAGTFVHTLGDAHIYSNHMEQVQELKRRNTFMEVPPLPTLCLDADITLDNIQASDIHLIDYEPLPTIKAEVAI